MKVFLTGASGFIGLPLVRELIGAGHQVLGLARSDAAAQSVKAAGAQVHRGDVEDLDSLRSGAADADAVIHTAFIHDFSKFQENCEIDRRAIEAMGSVLAGSARPFIVTSGTGRPSRETGAPRTEDDPPVSSKVFPRMATEEAAAAVAAQGVPVIVMRLPQVHDTEKQGLITRAILIAREKGVSAYIGDGSNRWAACARFDAVHLYRLALEKGVAATYHAVAEEGVSMREIAEVIGTGLNVPIVSLKPEEVPAHFGFLAPFASLDLQASSAKTRQALGWNPTGPSLIEDLRNMHY